MTPFPGLRRVFRIAGVRRDVKADLDEELDFHFQCTVEDLVAQGMTPSAAREEAHRRFGDLRQYRRELESIGRKRVTRDRLAEFLLILRQNVGYTLRGIRRSPGFTLAVALTLALGIGANATMFGVVDRLLLSPPAHVRDADQVRRLHARMHSRRTGRSYHQTVLSYPDYVDWTNCRSFESVAAYATDEVTVGRGLDAVRVTGGLATGSFFRLLGVQPALGRFFAESDDRSAPDVAVLSYGFWQRRFGGDPSVLGRTLQAGPGRFTIIGVAPRGFTGIDLTQVDLWAPLHAYSLIRGSDAWEHLRTMYWIQIVARLRPDAGVEAAETEATHLHRAGRSEQIQQGHYDPDVTVVAAPIVEGRGPNAPAESVVSVLLAGVSLVVLLIACANVANLLLVRGLRRRREIAVRLALGISRRRLVGQLLSESVLLAVLGGATALLVAAWGAELMRSVFLADIAWTESALNPRVLAFTAVLATVTGLASGLVPALQSSRPDLVNDLKDSAREGTVRRSRTRAALLVAQGTLSVVLLVGAGLFVRSLQRVQSIELGLDPEGVLLARLELEPGERTPEQVSTVYDRALERLRAVPAVEHASASTGIPFWGGSIEELFVPGLDSIPAPPPGPWVDGVTPGYLATLRMSIRRGRDFNDGDVAGATRVAIVNESMARGIWGNKDPLGECLMIGSADAPCTQVIGIVADTRRQRVVESQKWIYFVPVAQYAGESPAGLFIRGRIDARQLAPVVQRELMAGDPDVRYAVVGPLQDLIDPQLRAYTLGATMFTVFGLLALIVAAVGLYSVLAFNVAQRTHEIGVRSALGASNNAIVGQILKEAVGLTLIGLTIGLLIALAAGGSVGHLLYEISPRDPLVLGTVTLALLLVAAAAGAIPAARAARVDPNDALRVQ